MIQARLQVFAREKCSIGKAKVVVVEHLNTFFDKEDATARARATKQYYAFATSNLTASQAMQYGLFIWLLVSAV
jgi:hypothetical protein